MASAHRTLAFLSNTVHLFHAVGKMLWLKVSQPCKSSFPLTNRAKVGKFKVSPIDLADIAPSGTFDLNAEPHPLLHDADLVGRHLHPPKLCLQLQSALLGNDEEITIGAVEAYIDIYLISIS